MNAMMKAGGQVIRKLHELGTKNSTAAPEFVPPPKASNEAVARLHDQFKWVWEYSVATHGVSHFTKRRDAAKKKCAELGVFDGRESVQPGVTAVLWVHPPMQVQYRRNKPSKPRIDPDRFIVALRKLGVPQAKIDEAAVQALVEPKAAEFINVVESQQLDMWGWK